LPAQTGPIRSSNPQLLEYIISAELVFSALMVGAVIVLAWRVPQPSDGTGRLAIP
jgi:hypothetical protein